MTESKISNSLTWVIGGAQGSGVDSAANIFSKACSNGGLHIFGKREYYSNIKGEHSYFTVRVSDNQIRSHVDDIDILVSFDAETIFRHGDKVTKGGAIIYDSESANISIKEVPTLDDFAYARITRILEEVHKPLTVQGMVDYAKDNGSTLYKIPYFQILKEFSEKVNDHSLSKLTRMTNVMALSASMAILDFDSEVLAKAIKYIFKTKPKIADVNIAAANYSYNYIKSKFDVTGFKFKLTCNKPSSDIILVQGSQSSAMAKIVAGCRFQTYYPITPASDDSEFLESNQIMEQAYNDRKGSVLVIQTEDEIAAITMAIGGALTGVRSATATSGPGFSLMAEALGWAGINEVPVVVSLYQRAGPSTGLPTRHEQGDLIFAINCGHGEFPKIVFASGDIEESFYDTIKAFNFAEKYQLPVIHMLDKAIANSIMTCKIFDQHSIKIDRGHLLENVPQSAETGTAGNYRRFKLDINPISPRIALGKENGIFWNTGDEHTEEGHITEDPDNRIKMMNKRMSKLDLALKEIPDEDKARAYGQDDPSSGVTIVSWGSTKGAILDAIDRLVAEGKKAKFIQIRLMHPFPTALVEKMLANSKVLVDIEMNYTSQLGVLIKQNLSRSIDYKIVKYNGRPMSSSEVYNALMSIINGNAKRRIVLEHGT
ncbi:MAG TPA: 2-oxoacid:ferredoxin oxidoreductase subunit alpha [Nitrososphaeraceae archaeon]|nr:2-oxoacid:ferredoxin oxidoreductase subunit alpha [Nitrososphaeraceae archaeon]